MQRQTQFTLHAWLRAVGFAGLAIGILLLLYQLLMFIDLHSWQSVGIADAIHGLGWDEVYWLPSAEAWPIANKLMRFLLNFPIWIFGVALWALVRLFVGSTRKDETI